MVQIVNPVFRRNPNQLCSARKPLLKSKLGLEGANGI
jgi:hypothetical protein